MSLIECASQLKIAKNSQKHYFFWGGGISRSFKVIDVGTLGKVVSSDCYDKRNVRVYICNSYHARFVDDSRNWAF